MLVRKGDSNPHALASASSSSTAALAKVRPAAAKMTCGRRIISGGTAGALAATMIRPSASDPNPPPLSRRGFLAGAIGVSVGWPVWADAQRADDASIAQVVRSVDSIFA